LIQENFTILIFNFLTRTWGN